MLRKMKDQKAASLFHGKEKLNCAQAVLKAFQEEASIPDSAINEAKAAGGGRAPDGLCGAVHSAKLLASNDFIRDQIDRSFIEIAGSTRCYEIRGLKKLSCSGCVALAARLLENSDQRLMENKENDDPATDTQPEKIAA